MKDRTITRVEFRGWAFARGPGLDPHVRGCRSALLWGPMLERNEHHGSMFSMEVLLTWLHDFTEAIILLVTIFVKTFSRFGHVL